MQLHQPFLSLNSFRNSLISPNNLCRLLNFVFEFSCVQNLNSHQVVFTVQGAGLKLCHFQRAQVVRAISTANTGENIGLIKSILLQFCGNYRSSLESPYVWRCLNSDLYELEATHLFYLLHNLMFSYVLRNGQEILLTSLLY